MKGGAIVSPFSKSYILDLVSVLDRFPHDDFERMIAALIEAYHEKRNVFVMGNGGSGSTASHWACDINKGCSFGKRNRFRMICLNDNIPTMLAYANDISYNDVFVEQLMNFFVPGDAVIAISGSGNSPNVLRAIEYANKNEGTTIGLCGFRGGKLRNMVDIPVLVDIDDMQKIEDTHMIVVHMAMQRVHQILSAERPVKLVQEAGA